MKFTILSASSIIGGIAIFPFQTAPAIEPAADTETPPAALLRETPGHTPEISNNPEREAGKNIPFIGLATATLPDMVADHLKIDPGTGVIIRTVCPDSPAGKAGLSVNDIILSIAGTAVGNPEAVTSVVRQHKTGDRIPLELIHKGKPAKVEITLAERPADLAPLQQEPLLDGLPQAHAERLRGLLDQSNRMFGNGGVSPEEIFENNFHLMRERMNRAFEDAEAPGITQDADGGIQFQQNSTIRMMDGEGSIEIKSADGKTDAVVRDTKNEITWSGPWDTAEEKAAAPEEIRNRINQVNSGTGNGFNFRFGKIRESKPDTIDN